MPTTDLTPGTVTTLGSLRPGDVGEFIPESEGFVVQEAWPSGKVVVQYDDDHGAAPYLPTRKVRYLGRGRIEPARIVMDGEADRVAGLEAGLIWTDAKPTVPGWYWHRSQAGQRADIGYYRDEQILLDGCLEWVIHLKGQFAGPIPTPKEKPCAT